MSVTTFPSPFPRGDRDESAPIQKRIRLYEARRMLFSGDVDATNVSLDVGYVSASQFNREYRRLFGKPPGRDAAQVRKEPAERSSGLPYR
jgi:transcriptional regulator GlxA family with amidase domain